MAGSTINLPIQVCPQCGYCCHDLADEYPQAAEIVTSRIYQTQLKNPEYPELANWFLCHALIQKQAGEFAQAGWASLQAAWVCDDAKNDKAAQKSRQQAAALFQKAIAKGENIDREPLTKEVILIDIYRRSGDFDAARRICDNALRQKLEGITTKLLEYEHKLLRQQDKRFHTFEEAVDVISVC
jgi:tetratricopeptide (TPR) repeat protein